MTVSPFVLTQGIALNSFLSNSNSNTNSPIKHLIVIMKENHSFDNYFGEYPGVKGGLNSTICERLVISDPQRGCVKPFELTAKSRVPSTLDHFFGAAYTDWNHGKMNNFIAGEKLDKYTMGYYTNATIPNYWKYANNYVLADNFYSSIFGWSLPNHWLAISGNTPGCAVVATCANSRLHGSSYLMDAQGIPTIADLLINSSVSWKYYDYAMGTNYTKAVQIAEGARGCSAHSACNLWNPFAAQKRSYSAIYSQHYVSNIQIFSDLKQGNLPAVSYVIPSYEVSEHPSHSVTIGMEWTTDIVNAVMNSRYWNSSAIIISWDDYGGFYDSIAPPKLANSNECINLPANVKILNPDCYLGFRVPTIIISPYAKHGFLDNTQYSFESILKFIEWNWNLSPLDARDADAHNLLTAFNFKSQIPNPPTVIPMSASLSQYLIQIGNATGPDAD